MSYFHTTREWADLSRKLRKEQPYCSHCKGRVNLSVHHLLERCLYPEFQLSPINLIVLCRRCHLALEKTKGFRAWLARKYPEKSNWLMRVDRAVEAGKFSQFVLEYREELSDALMAEMDKEANRKVTEKRDTAIKANLQKGRREHREKMERKRKEMDERRAYNRTFIPVWHPSLPRKP